jgi:hypothetical protein
VRGWPAGEGTLVHFDGQHFTRYRAPDGALLSVVAVGPGEAWAVGMGGGVLHVRAGEVEAFHVDDAPLRSVAVGSDDAIWIAGDRSLLLRVAAALERVDTTAVGPDAALTTVIAPGAQPGWVVGPSGMWRIR